MRGQGEDYPGPVEARAFFLSGTRPPVPFRTETRVAGAEARCAVSSGLAATARSLDAACADRLPERYRRFVRTARRMALAALGRAGAIVRRA
jgi:hypothetical protein